MLMNGQNVELNTLLLASIVDRLSLLVWAKTKDAEKNKNKPKSLVEELNNLKIKEEYISCKSGKEFEKKRKEIIKEMEKSDGN